MDEVDGRTLPVKMRVALNNKFAHAIYIVADPGVPSGEVIDEADLVQGIDLSLSIVLVTPRIEREAKPCQ